MLQQIVSWIPINFATKAPFDETLIKFKYFNFSRFVERKLRSKITPMARIDIRPKKYML